MKTRTRLSVWMAGVAGIMIASGVGRAWAAPYTWNSTSGGNWDDGTATGWNTGGAYPNAQGDTATFSQDLGANATITLNVADGRVGTLTLTDSGADNNKFGWILSGSNPLAFDVAAGSATINATGSTVLGERVTTHRIIAPITCSAPLTLNLGANGGLGLSGNNASLTGGITVNGSGAQPAFVRFDSAASLGAGGNTITVNSGANAVINFASLSQTDLNRFSNSAGLVSFYADFLDHLNDPYNATAFSPAPNLDLTGYNEYFRLGAAGFAYGTGGATTLSGTFTPPSSTFRFGGGGGLLTVDCVLADGAAARSVEISGTEAVFGSFSLLALTKANTYTGPTEVRNGVLRLAGSNGTALNTSAFNVRSYAYFQLDGGLKAGWANETGPVVGNNNNRVADTTPVNLYGGSLNFFGNQASGTTESIGALNVNSGWNVLDARWKSGRIYYRTATVEEQPFENRDEAGTGAAVLTAQSLNLTNGAQLKLRGVNVGVAGSSATRVMFNTAPTMVGGGGGAGSTTISIIPGVWYNPNLGIPSSTASLGVYQWVTYDGSVGLRALDNATEYSALADGETSDKNAQHTFTGSSPTLNLSSATTVNSLKVENNADGTSTISGQALTLKSGCLLVENKESGAAAVTLSAPLDFNGNAGQVFWYTTIFANAPILNSVMSNTGGKGVNLLASNVRELTKPGDERFMGPVYISGANTYTGPTTINAGRWQTIGNERLPDATDLRIRAGATLTIGGGNTETVASLAGAGTLALESTTAQLILGSGAGLAGAVTLEGASAYIAPGDLGVGTLTLSGLSAADGLRLRSGELRIDLMHAQGYDVLAVGSTKVTISDAGNGYAGSTLVLNLGNAPSVGDTFKILDVAGSTAVVGKFSNGDTVKGAMANGNKYAFDILYNSALGGGDGNDVVLRCTGKAQQGILLTIR